MPTSARGLEAPRGFLAGLADHGLEQRLAIFDVPGGLIEHQAAADAFLDHEEAAVALDDGGDGDFRLPGHAAVIYRGRCARELVGRAGVPDLVELVEVLAGDRRIVEIGDAVPAIRVHAVDDGAVVGDQVTAGALLGAAARRAGCRCSSSAVGPWR